MLYLCVKSGKLRIEQQTPTGKMIYIDSGFLQEMRAYELDPQNPAVKRAIAQGNVKPIQFVEAQPHDSHQKSKRRSAKPQPDEIVSKG